MAHALAAFITEQMDAKKLRQRDVVSASGLSRALVSKYAADNRERLTRLPERDTLDGFAKALHVPIDVLIGKAIEALDLGYVSGDFINGVATADDRELLDEIERRLAARHVSGDSPRDSVTTLRSEARQRPGASVQLRDDEVVPDAARRNPKRPPRGPKEQGAD